MKILVDYTLIQLSSKSYMLKCIHEENTFNDNYIHSKCLWKILVQYKISEKNSHSWMLLIFFKLQFKSKRAEPFVWETFELRLFDGNETA